MSAPKVYYTPALHGHRTHDEMSRACMSQQHSTQPAGARLLTVLALTATFAAMLAVPTGASARWFMVEIIVFDDPTDRNLDAEHWPADPGEPSLQGAADLMPPHGGAPDEAAHAFRLVRRSDLSLKGVWNALRRSDRYRPFLHAGWRLPGLPHSVARPAHVSPNLGIGGLDAAEHDGVERPAVQGTVKVSLARYLRVDVDLLYSRPESGAAAAPDPAPAQFRLVSERRMRSGELHYIDHPLFGVLIRIKPHRHAPRSAPEA